MKFLFTAFFSIFILCVPALAQAEKLKVVASFSILGDMAHEVAGDDTDLKILVGPNSDAHAYEPTPGDARALSHADMVIVNGLGFEGGWLTRLIGASGYKGPLTVATKGIAPLMLKENPNTPDPHAWQSLANGKIYAANIRDALAAADPVHAKEYKARAARYIKRLDDIDRRIKKDISAVPKDRRKVIATHDAFGYFSKAYGVAFIAPLGLNTQSEASAADLARLIDQIRAQKVRAVFMENITDPRLIRQIQRDGGAVPGGTLYSDALSAPGGTAASYTALFENNAAALVKGMMAP